VRNSTVLESITNGKKKEKEFNYDILVDFVFKNK